MTHYEKMKQMSVEEMAEILYKSDNTMDKICHEMTAQKIGVCGGDENEVNPCNCKKCVKKWLETEVENDIEGIISASLP